MGFDQLLPRVALFIPVIFALTVHEWAHARTALELGDDTAMQLGRLTLNPLAHLDPIGTVLLPLIGVPFGWAKPVPIDPNRFRPEVTMEKGLLLAAAAGPIANLVLAMLSAAPLRLAAPGTLSPAMEFLLSRSVAINLALAVFNLLPIPPLDGSRIADALIPFAWRGAWNRLSGAGGFILIALFVVPQLFGLPIGDWLTTFSSHLMGR